MPFKNSEPPGTVMVKEGLFMDKEEITNSMWRAFAEGWLLNVENDTAQYKNMLQDSTVWYSLRGGEAKRYMTDYATSSEFANYPVVGITYEQALAYCSWRTDRVNEMLRKSQKSSFKPILYRLPTEAEWEFAAAGKLDTAKFPYGYESTKERFKNGDSAKMFNCYYRDFDSIANNLYGKVLPVNWGKPNAYGIYNIIGNAGEMVSEKGLAKGGFYDLPVQYCKIKEQSSYNSPNRYLGFRCVCTYDSTSSFGNKPQTGFKKPTKEEKKGKETEKKPEEKKPSKKDKKKKGFIEEDTTSG